MQMTRKRLDSYQRLIQEIEILRQELNDMNTTDAGIGHSIIIDYQKGFPRPQAVVGFDGDRYRKKRKQLDKKEQDEVEIRNWIEDIDDAVTRKVFRLYYINGLSWVDVAKQMGYRGNPDYPRKHIRDKYLIERKIK